MLAVESLFFFLFAEEASGGSGESSAGAWRNGIDGVLGRSRR